MTESKMDKCPHAKSDMTPCYLKDGDLAVGFSGWGSTEKEICVGCERGVERLRKERAGQETSGRAVETSVQLTGLVVHFRMVCDTEADAQALYHRMTEEMRNGYVKLEVINRDKVA